MKRFLAICTRLGLGVYDQFFVPQYVDLVGVLGLGDLSLAVEKIPFLGIVLFATLAIPLAGGGTGLVELCFGLVFFAF